MTGATVLAGIGAFGHRVITRIEQSLSDPEGRVQLLARPAPGDVVTGVHQALEALLEAGRYRATSTGQRLDLFLFANAAVLDGDALLETCADLGDLVQAQYGAMFDLRLPPEQRTAALHVVLWTPALTDSPESREVLGRLLRLQSWFERPETRIRGNLLARVWLMPQVGKAGQLKAEGLIASATAFALATVGSGLREQERIRELLRHPPVDAGRFALLTVASLTVPEAAVRDYAIQRAIYDGLEELRTRVQGAHPDRDRAMAAVGGLDHGRWVNPLDAATDAARGLKKLAAVLSGAGGGLPATAEVGAFDDAATIREKHAPLFRAASTDRTLGAAQDDHVKTQLQGLDKVEAELVRDVHHRLRELFDKKLRQAALRSLPDVENGLRAVAALLDDHAQRNSARLGESRPPPDPYREELEAAVRALPDAALMRASGLVVGAAVAFPVFMLVGGADPQAAAPAMPTIAATSAASAAPAAVPFPVAELVPFGVALALGVVAFLAWYWIASHFAREGVRRVLTQRLMAVRELWAGGGGGRNERQAEDQLDLRRQRVRRVARLAIGHALNHISSFKLGINRALDRAGQHLRAMSVEPTSSPATDDLRRLWGEGDHLHQPLVSPRRVAEWVSRARVKAGAPEWADALLERSWPRRDDDAHDEPCADQALLVAAAQAQVAAIEVAPASGAGSVTSLLSDGGVRDEAAAQVARFVQHAVAALDQPMLPLRDDGTPAGQAAMAPLAIAPRVALDRFEEAYKHSQLTVTPLWVDSPAPRVVFVRAWDGYTAEEVARGAGLAPGGRPA